VLDALNNNLSTPAALQLVDEIFASVEASPREAGSQNLTELLQVLDDLLGLDLIGTTPDITDEQKILMRRREDARAAKDWSASDALREELASSGIMIRDTAQGQIWEY
jgi:cysteinyl-tRNA synthetase